jgi:hypothetical protein
MTKRAKRASATMGAPPKPPAQPARDVVADLIDRPPMNDGELERRLQHVEPEDARREIVDRLFDGGAPRETVDLLASALLVLGATGHETRLERIAADPRRSRSERWTALSLVYSTSPERANRVLVGLQPTDGLQLTLQPAAEAVSDVLTDPAHGDTIADALEALPHELRPEAFAYLEELRRRAESPAVLVYRELLQRQGVEELRDLILEAVVKEGGAEAAAELVELRNEASAPGSQKAFQRALLRLGTRAIEAPAKALAPKGQAHLGICDGQGAFIVLGCFENKDGTTSIADLCIRASAEVRDGFAAASMDEREIRTLFERMRESGLGDLAPLSLADAAEIVFAGVERTRQAGLSVPQDARAAVLLFERALGARVASGDAPGPQSSPVTMADAPGPARGPVTLAEARALLALPCYESWFFDAGDLAAAGVILPQKPTRSWTDGALARLETSEVVPRLLAMLPHMARWHALRGEADRAAICRTAFADMTKSFRKAAVPRVMLERSIQKLHAHAATKVGVVGDPDARQRIRMGLFLDVNDPKGRDLAALDLTEAALFAVTDAIEALPGSRRPREDDVLHASGAVANLFVRWVLSRRQRAPDALVGDMEKAVEPLAALTAAERSALVAKVLPAMATFVAEVCERCPVACLTHPKADAAAAFFAETHPAFD